MSWQHFDAFEQGFVEGWFKGWRWACELLAAFTLLPLLTPFALVYLVRQITRKVRV
jgi:hypothetical protein